MGDKLKTCCKPVEPRTYPMAAMASGVSGLMGGPGPAEEAKGFEKPHLVGEAAAPASNLDAAGGAEELALAMMCTSGFEIGVR